MRPSGCTLCIPFIVAMVTYEVHGFYMGPPDIKYPIDNNQNNVNSIGEAYQMGPPMGGHSIVDCHSILEYMTLTSLLHQDDCSSMNSMFSLLEKVNRKSEICMELAIKRLAHEYFHSDMPASCQCSGHDIHTHYHSSSSGIKENYISCTHEHGYMGLFNDFYTFSHHYSPKQCLTHHSLWADLNRLTDSRTCLDDIVQHVNHKYRNGDPCSCTVVVTTTVATTPAPQTTASSGVVTTTVATTPAPQTIAQARFHCEDIPTYSKLLLLGQSDLCLSANSIWHYLDEVEIVSSSCRRKLVDTLAATFRNKSLNCDCQPTTELIDERPVHLDNGSYRDCSSVHDSTYDDIDRVLFSETKEHGCQDHSYVWTALDDIHRYHTKHHGTVDCTKDLIIRASLQYKKNSDDPCVCSKKTTTVTAPQTTTMSASSSPTTSNPVTTAAATSKSPATTQALLTQAPTTTTKQTVATTTTQIPLTAAPATQAATTVTQTTMAATTQNLTTAAPVVTTTSTQAPAVTTTQNPTTQKTPMPLTPSPQPTTTASFVVTATTSSGMACDKSRLLLDMATATIVKSPLAQDCSLTGNDEALVIKECNLPASSSWKKGLNIQQDCLSGSPTIPVYTPIATFTGDTYVSTGGHSAIFVGCTTRGFSAIVQYCGNSPLVVESSSGVYSNQYHTIV
ncbi:hypothetical protein ACF0H5_023665 [Mactra antiquata]